MASTARAQEPATDGTAQEASAPAAQAAGIAPELQRFLDQFQGGRIALTSEEAEAPITGTVGRDLQAERPEFNIVGGQLAAQARRAYKVVSFYTVGNGYDVHAARLRASLEALGVDHEITPVPDAASWESVCAFKSQFLLDQWRASDVPVVWIDADAVVEQAPELFAFLEADFAAHKWTWEPGREQHGFELTSGTLYFGRTAAAGALLERWAARCAADPSTWDQRHLHSAWCDVSAIQPLRTLWLPRSYYQIDGAAELSPAVIRHMQASRVEKARRPTPPVPQFGLTTQGLDDRRRNRLWRTPQQAFWISEGVDHIIPAVGGEFPEGFDVGAVLRRCFAPHDTILEFGCGVGRIAGLLDPARYLGVDVNPQAVTAARRACPNHAFRLWDDGERPPASDALLFYTVLLHVSDDELVGLLLNLTHGRQRVVIAERTDVRWRRAGDPPVFNRDQEVYIMAMRLLGFDLARFEKHVYARYDTPQWRLDHDVRQSFLTFEAR